MSKKESTHPVNINLLRKIVSTFGAISSIHWSVFCSVVDVFSTLRGIQSVLGRNNIRTVGNVTYSWRDISNIGVGVLYCGGGYQCKRTNCYTSSSILARVTHCMNFLFSCKSIFKNVYHRSKREDWSFLHQAPVKRRSSHALNVAIRFGA